MTAFWFVWNPEGNAPRYQHPSLDSAATEAERLANRHPGQTFIVLQTVCSFRNQAIVRVDLRPDLDIPF